MTIVTKSALASTITYEIYDYSKDKNGHLVAAGSKEYSDVDINIACDNSHCKKILLLEQGYSVGASIYREQKLTGFGIWVRRNNQGFSWEWFNLDGNRTFKKLQEGGMVTVKYSGLPIVEEIAEIIFDTNISLRLNESNEVGSVTQRILIKKGSILKFTP